MQKKLTTVQEVKTEYAALPKLLDSWLMVGYRQWYRRTHLRKPKATKELEANKQLKSLNNEEWIALKKRVKSKLK